MQKSSHHTSYQLPGCKNIKSNHTCNIEIHCFRCNPLSLIHSNRHFYTYWEPTASSLYTCISPTLFPFAVKPVRCRYRHEHAICYMFLVLPGRNVPRKTVFCCVFIWMRHEAYLIQNHEKINLHLTSAHRDSWWDLLLTNRLPLTVCASSRMLFTVVLGC